jgi:hypothetical protein
MVKQRKRNPYRRKRKNGGRRTDIAAQAVNDVCSVTDPFCHHAEGAYDPKGTSRFTIPFTQRGVNALSTDAVDGIAMGAFGCGFSTALATTVSGDTLTVTNFALTTGTIPDFVNEARVVSAGVRWWCPLAATSAGGLLAVVPIQDWNNGDWGTGISYDVLLNTPGTQIFPLRSQGEYIFSRTDAPAHHFKDASANREENNDWDGVVFIAIGETSVQCINVESIYHLEGTVKSTEGIAIGSKGSPTNPLALSATKSRNFYGVFEGTGKAVANQLKSMATQYTQSALRAGVSYGVSAIGNAMVPGLGTAAAVGGNIIMDVD